MNVMSDAEALLKESLSWLKAMYNDYNSFLFFEERDVVWILQKRLIKTARDKRVPYKIFNNCKIGEMQPPFPHGKKAPQPDLIILRNDRIRNGKLVTPLDVIVEFKFEPSHARVGEHFLSGKVPLIDKFSLIEKDLIRIEQYVTQRKAYLAYSVLVDEGGYYSKKLRKEEWQAWGDKIFSKRYPAVKE